MKRLLMLLPMALFLAWAVSSLTAALVAYATDPPAMPTPLVFPPLEGEALILPLAAVDGDTLDFCWLIRDRGRLYGINAPEVHSKDPGEKAAGLASKANLAKLLPAVPVRAKLHGREKYGRALVEVFTADGKSLSQVQVEGGYAKAWDGKGERP